VVSLIVLAHPSGADGQDNPYTPALLATIRREAQALPGPRPRDLRYLVVAEALLRLDMVVADAIHYQPNFDDCTRPELSAPRPNALANTSERLASITAV